MLRVSTLLVISFAFAVTLLMMLKIAFGYDVVGPCGLPEPECPGFTCPANNCSPYSGEQHGCPVALDCDRWWSDRFQCQPNSAPCPCPPHCGDGWCYSSRACICPWNESCYFMIPPYNCTYCVFDNNPGYCDGGETVPCPN
jgi:hypothetical protein